MAATTKDELLDVTQKEFAKLTKLITSIDHQTAMKKRDEDTSIKDVVAHRAHWIALFLGWYADGQADKEVFFPAPGYKWNDLKRYNADLRQRQADLDWAAARDMLNQNHEALVAFINGCSDAELYGGPMKGAQNAWTPGRWAEAAGPSHFRSAAKFLRSALKSTTATC
ncbi:ClbS/DfsB family four-helix bundle protein [Pseudophaeobacter sp.]|uniref:ClbS/DfsB family four-helix bundle protein n=1 Tax=Pseudophaeobacter sp. TaxID=1971739 RepID=UPI0032980629